MVFTEEDWLSPLNRILWQTAFRNKNTTLKLRDGREFVLDYSRVDPTTGLGRVYVKPKLSLAPSGWFDYERVCDSLWIILTSRDTIVQQQAHDFRATEKTPILPHGPARTRPKQDPDYSSNSSLN